MRERSDRTPKRSGGKLSNKLNWELQNRRSKLNKEVLTSEATSVSNRVIKSKFDTKCSTCGGHIKKDSSIRYYFDIKMATHVTCKSPLKEDNGKENHMR